MRVFELTAHLQKISRALGRSATAAAAYRSCSEIACERDGMVHDYRRKGGLEASQIVLPESAPGWALDRSRLWNAAELRERNGERGRNAGAFKAKAVTAREIMFGFPAELSAAGRIEVAGIIARHLAEKHEVAADFSIHLPGKEGDQRNHHCHMMFTSRRLTMAGLGKKTREWDGRLSGSATLTALRAFLAQTMNEALVREGKAVLVHVEHRSFKARGSGRTPQKHMGPGQTHVVRNTLTRERIGWERGVRDRQAERHATERAAIQDLSSPAALELAETHLRENAQLEQAVIARKGRDRALETVKRRQAAERLLVLQQEHGRSRGHD